MASATGGASGAPLPYSELLRRIRDGHPPAASGGALPSYLAVFDRAHDGVSSHPPSSAEPHLPEGVPTYKELLDRLRRDAKVLHRAGSPPDAAGSASTGRRPHLSPDLEAIVRKAEEARAAVRAWQTLPPTDPLKSAPTRTAPDVVVTAPSHSEVLMRETRGKRLEATFPKALAGDSYEHLLTPETRAEVLAFKQQIRDFVRVYIVQNFGKPISLQIADLEARTCDLAKALPGGEFPPIVSTVIDTVRRYFVREHVNLFRERGLTKDMIERDYHLPPRFTEELDALVHAGKANFMKSTFTENFVEYWCDFPTNVGKEVAEGRRPEPTLAELKERIIEDITAPVPVDPADLRRAVTAFRTNLDTFRSMLRSTFFRNLSDPSKTPGAEEVATVARGIERERHIIELPLLPLLSRTSDAEKKRISLTVLGMKADEATEYYLAQYHHHTHEEAAQKDKPMYLHSKTIHGFSATHSRNMLMLSYGLMTANDKKLFDERHPDAVPLAIG